MALGFCNLFGSFVQSMPIAACLSRTAVNSASGVKTPLGGIYTGGLVIMCLAVLMPYCSFIPKATLAAVIITAVIFSVEYQQVIPIWKSKSITSIILNDYKNILDSEIDLLPGFACFFVCLFYEMQMGIILGVIIQILILLYHVARPGVKYSVKKVKKSLNSW